MVGCHVRFEPNTVLWAFHTLQPSSFVLLGCRCQQVHVDLFISVDCTELGL